MEEDGTMNFNERHQTIEGHSCVVEYEETEDGLRCMVTSQDRKTVADGYGKTKGDAYEEARVAFARKAKGAAP